VGSAGVLRNSRLSTRRGREPPLPGRCVNLPWNHRPVGLWSVHTEKAKVFQAMRPLKPRFGARQYVGYRKEPDAGEELRRRDFLRSAAVHRLMALGWRAMVSALRQILGRNATEVLVELKPPPQRLFADSAPNDRSGPTTCAFGSLPARPSPSPLASSSREGVRWGAARALPARRTARRGAPYERLLGDAMTGDGALFTRETQLRPPGRSSIQSLRPTTGLLPTSAAAGAKEADVLIASDGPWINPQAQEER